MMTLVTGLWKMFFRKDEYRVLLLGLDNAGKTTVLEKIKGLHSVPSLPAEKICPTVGLNIGRIELQHYKLLLWDLGGKKSLRPIWDKFMDQAHGVVFVIDASLPRGDPKWREVKECLADTLAAPALAATPLLIFSNKMDVPGAMSSSDLLHFLADGSGGADGEAGTFLATYFETHPAYRILPCCGLTGEKLDDGMNWLIQYLQMRQQFELS